MLRFALTIVLGFVLVTATAASARERKSGHSHSRGPRAQKATHHVRTYTKKSGTRVESHRSH